MTITFRPGKRDPNPDLPRLRFAAFRAPKYALAVPDDVNWIPAGITWPMYRNDQYGDCELADEGHQILSRTALAGRPVVPTDEDVLRQYTKVAGFDPNDPSTDVGVLLQDALNVWRKDGFLVTTGPKTGVLHGIQAFAEVDHRNPEEILAALYVFGALTVGLQVPQFAMDQFNAGQPWTLPAFTDADDRNLGGHAVELVRATKRPDGSLRLWVVTWGQLQEVSWAFWSEFMDETWCTIASEWLRSDGFSPAGLNLSALGEQFSGMTGQPNPIPVDPQPPAPGPDPVVPVPPAPDPDATLWNAVRAWAQHPTWRGAKRVARALRAWARAHGFLSS